MVLLFFILKVFFPADFCVSHVNNYVFIETLHQNGLKNNTITIVRYSQTLYNLRTKHMKIWNNFFY